MSDQQLAAMEGQGDSVSGDKPLGPAAQPDEEESLDYGSFQGGDGTDRAPPTPVTTEHTAAAFIALTRQEVIPALGRLGRCKTT